ncbi:MAG: DUF4282 domain-containing protein [Planctomycetota bacterium]|jgi:hypothetical protein
MSIRDNEFVNVFMRVFDWSFTSFMTPYILKIVYPGVIALQTVLAILFVVSQFSSDLLAGIGATMLTLILWPLAIGLTRIYFECLAAIFLTFEKISAESSDENYDRVSWRQNEPPSQPNPSDQTEAAA